MVLQLLLLRGWAITLGARGGRSDAMQRARLTKSFDQVNCHRGTHAELRFKLGPHRAAPCKHRRGAPRAASGPASSLKGSLQLSPSPPARRSKRTKAKQAAEPTQPTKGTGQSKGRAAKQVVVVAGRDVRWEQGINRVVQGLAQVKPGLTDAPVELVINLTCHFDITHTTPLELELNRAAMQASLSHTGAAGWAAEETGQGMGQPDEAANPTLAAMELHGAADASKMSLPPELGSLAQAQLDALSFSAVATAPKQAPQPLPDLATPSQPMSQPMAPPPPASP
ncbi:CBM20 domain-containing protein, partial [Haematococcus lacustris]